MSSTSNNKIKFTEVFNAAPAIVKSAYALPSYVESGSEAKRCNITGMLSSVLGSSRGATGHAQYSYERTTAKGMQ
jgi:hypothetical protein